MKFSILLLLATLTTYSQNSISGKILDTNSDPVAYATIYLPQLEKGTATDEDGGYVINDLPNGNFKMIISLLGYESKSIIISVPDLNQLEITLEPSAIEMQQVIVSTPFHKLQNDNVMKVERQNVSELQKQGAINLADGITNISGVESITTGVSVGKPVIRGLSGNRVLVYTQGIRLENQQFGDEHGLGINSSGIESVEVIKGPSSLLYGSDALGGVLYLNPERFADQGTTTASMQGSYFTNTNGYSTSVGAKTSSNNFKYLVRGSLAGHSDYKTEDYRATNTRFKEEDIKVGIGYQKNKVKTELRYNYYATDIGLTEGIGDQTTDKTPVEPFQDLENHIISSKSAIFLNKSSFDISLGYTYNDRKEYEEHEESGIEIIEEENEEEAPALHMKLKTFNYDLKYNAPTLGRFETIVGLQGMYQTNENFGEEILIPNASTFDFGILATSHVHFKTLDIQFGARFDNRKIDVDNSFSRDFSSFNAAAGIKTNVLDRLTVRFNVASGFRAPNLAELTSDGTHEGTNRYEIGDADLNNEQNLQLDLSLEFKSEHLELFGNLFYNYINDYIFLNPNGDFVENDPVFLYEQDNARLYGGEFGLHLHPHPLDWLHIESSFETVTAKRSNDNYLPLTPANSLNNVFRVEFTGEKFKNTYSFIKLQSVFDQNNVSAFETTTPAYNLLSAGIGSTIQILENDLQISITATNITNERYISHLSRLKQNDIFNIGRNIIFNLRYSI